MVAEIVITQRIKDPELLEQLLVSLIANVANGDNWLTQPHSIPKLKQDVKVKRGYVADDCYGRADRLADFCATTFGWLA